MECQFDGSSSFFRGTLTTFAVDNLAAWSVGGFKQLASQHSENVNTAWYEDMQVKVQKRQMIYLLFY